MQIVELPHLKPLDIDKQETEYPFICRVIHNNDSIIICDFGNISKFNKYTIIITSTCTELSSRTVTVFLQEF